MFADVHTGVLAGLGVLGLFNLIISIGLLRDSGLTALQKSFQLALAWLIPVFGGLTVLVIQASHHTREEMKSLVPYPFYMAAADASTPNANRDEFGHADYPAEGSCGEGSCGSD